MSEDPYSIDYIIDISEQESSSERPTCELRWVNRPSPFDWAMPAIPVLQQRWRIISYRGNRIVDARGEWRDVPTVTE